MFRRFLPALVVACAASFAPASFYQYDDGISDTSVSTSGSSLNVVYLTQYTAASGGLNLTSIDVVWGSKQNPNLANGFPVQVLLMSDPNQDGDPMDSQVLQSINTTTVNVGTDTFNNYALTPVALSLGQKFFLGVYIPNMPSGDTWSAIDTNSTGHSVNNWWSPTMIPGSGQSYISLGVFGSPDWTFMVRGNVSAVPEPATVAVLGLGLLAVVRRRKVRRS